MKKQKIDSNQHNFKDKDLQQELFNKYYQTKSKRMKKRKEMKPIFFKILLTLRILIMLVIYRIL